VIRILAFRLLVALAGPRRLMLIVVLAIGVTSLGGLAVPRSALGWGEDTFSADSEALLIAMQDQVRAAAGPGSLEPDAALRAVARWRSRDMVERGYFSHTIKGTDRQVFWYMEHEYGYCFEVAGENIGTVTWRGATEEDATKWVFDRFMDSAGHRANIMGAAWDSVAVGAYRATGDTFVWTVLFAARCGASQSHATP
jgi:uncharacterized protein YkwD